MAASIPEVWSVEYSRQTGFGEWGETSLDSVLVGQTAYEAEPGFLVQEHEIMDKLADTELPARYLTEDLL